MLTSVDKIYPVKYECLVKAWECVGLMELYDTERSNALGNLSLSTAARMDRISILVTNNASINKHFNIGGKRNSTWHWPLPRTNTPSAHLWFVGAVGCVSGLGALHFPNCLWDLQGDILWAYPIASGWTAEQLFGGFAWRCIRILIQVTWVI